MKQTEKGTEERMWKMPTEKMVNEIERNEPQRKREICNIIERKGYVRHKGQATGYKVQRAFTEKKRLDFKRQISKMPVEPNFKGLR